MMRGALAHIKYMKQNTLILNILPSIPMDLLMSLRYAQKVSFIYPYKNQSVADVLHVQ